MSYNKTTWQAGDTITAEKLNNIENGVEAASKMIATVHIVNQSSSVVQIESDRIGIFEGVVCYLQDSDNAMMSADTSMDIMILPQVYHDSDEDQDVVGLVFDVYSIGCDIVASDGLMVEPDGDRTNVRFEGAHIPADMTVTITDSQPLGEVRTVAIQQSADVGFPETITGRINEGVTVQTTAAWMYSVTMLSAYDSEADRQLYPSYWYSDPKTIVFRIPDMETVSETGYLYVYRVYNP